MVLWRAKVVAGLGLTGLAAQADELGWKPAAAPPPAMAATAPRVSEDVEPVTAGWQPTPLTPNPVPGDLVFRPATTLIVASPVGVRTPDGYQTPVNLPTVGDVPIPPLAPALPQSLTAPRPLSLSDGPRSFEVAPPPRPGVEALGSPRPDVATSSQVWGGYAPASGPVVAVSGQGVPPTRNRVFGSEDVTLSRDYHFRDVWGSSAGDTARTERRDRIAAALADRGGPATDRFLLQTEYLLWWVRPAGIPVLGTTGPDLGPNLSGILGQPGTQLLLGPGSFGATGRNGFRVRGGWWMDNHAPGVGVDGSYFFLGNQQTERSFGSAQYPVITRPFFAPNTFPPFNLPPGGAEFGERVASPGAATGILTVDNQSELWGADINLKCCLCRTCNYQSTWFGGFRFLGLEESLTITESIIAGPQSADPLRPNDTAILVQDFFGVRNRFYGPQIGYSVFRRVGRVSVDGRASLAMGVTNQELSISGFQLIQPPADSGLKPMFFSNGGLLAAGPNLGRFSNAAFGVVPEVTLNVGYQLTPTLRGYVGYNFMYWTNVIRPGDQIDRVVDLSFVPNSGVSTFSGIARPQATFNQTDLWVQGVQFGAELRW